MDNLDYQFPVCVRCMTYNHASFIKDAMNGFTMQQTNFPYVCVIVDDASTDGEPEVIRQYLSANFDLEDNTVARNEETDDFSLTYARHKTNLNCYFVVFFLKYNHYKKKAKEPYFKEWTENAKYYALCEGDDYWTASHKLQKQVEYMEEHEECGLCYTDCDMYFEKNAKWIRMLSGGKINPIDGENPLLQDNPGYRFNMTWLYRKDLYESFDPNPCFSDGAMYLLCNFCLVSKLAYIPIVSGVYRRHEGSASCFRSDQKAESYSFDKNMFELIKYFAPRFDHSERILRKAYSDRLVSLLPYAVINEDDVVIQDFESYYNGTLDIQSYIEELHKFIVECENSVRSTKSYLIGKFLLSPFIWIKRRLFSFL